MSAPTAEIPLTAPPARLTAWGLFGFAFGLMVLAAAAAFLLLGRGGPIDGKAEMVRVFGSADLPFGLELKTASVMPTGEKIVSYAAPGVVPTPAPAPVETPPSTPGVPGPRTDWSAVAIPATREPPEQATFLIVDKTSGRTVIEALVRNVMTPDTKGLGPQGGTVLIARGRADFRGWESDWVHLRTFEAGGKFRDAMRISISTPEQPVVMTATWPRGNPATREMLDELLKPLR